jgi:HAD superfamily hydrolase (TIGR01509 family)
MTPKVVAFDLGKVLVDFDFGIAAAGIARRSTRLGVGEVVKLLDYAPLLVRYESGQIDTTQFCTEAISATGWQGTREEFERAFADIFSAIDPMIELHAQLRQRGVPTWILSNTNDLAASWIRRRFPFFSNFDGYLLSYQVKVMKPSPAIYQLVEQRTGCSGAELLFMDDRKENVDAAAARGWQIIHHASPEATRRRIHELGLLGE